MKTNTAFAFSHLSNEELVETTGGAGFDPSVENCKGAFKSGEISTDDLKAFEKDHGYRGKSDASAACFASRSVFAIPNAASIVAL